MTSAARKKDPGIAELPKQAQVGDRIRLKPESISQCQEECKKAGWPDVDLYAVRVVTREDPFNPGGGRRLFFDGPPHCFASHDVILAWNTEDERRLALRARGWKV